MHDKSQPALSVRNHSLQSDQMLCPCCGNVRALAATECLACGAHQVGAPLAQPETLLPKLGPAFLAFGLVCVITIGYLAFWIFGSDMKVGRVLLRLALSEGTRLGQNLLYADPKTRWLLLLLSVIPLGWLGIGLARHTHRLVNTKLTELGSKRLTRAATIIHALLFASLGAFLLGKFIQFERELFALLVEVSAKLATDLLNADPKLPYYRIFVWDGWRNAFFLSAGIVPLSLLTFRLAQRAAHLARQRPAEFGGLRLARVALALSALLFITFSAAGLSGIPAALQRGRDRAKAANNVMMIEHNAPLEQYKRKYGTYPSEAADLARLKVSAGPQKDYWGNQFQYAPFGTIASRNNALGFSNYTLTSAGPDGEFGTSDDIVMIDGVIVDKPSDADLPPSLLAPEKKPRK